MFSLCVYIDYDFKIYSEINENWELNYVFLFIWYWGYY